MRTARRLSTIALAFAACGGDSERPAPDAAADASPDAVPTLTLQVSKDGSDLHDGFEKPVETLARAIEIATADGRVADIVLGPGEYTIRGGETFNYKVPAGVTIAGPTTGTAVLVGGNVGIGLQFTSGQVQNLELQNFNTAIDATVSLRVKNLKISSSSTAIHGARSAKLRIDNLQIGGLESVVCARGIVLEGELFATMVTISGNVGPVLEANNAGPIDISQGNFVTTSMCGRPMLEAVSMTSSFALSDSTIDGAISGINLVAVNTGPPVKATLTNTVVRHTSIGITARTMSFVMNGCSISDNGFTAFDGTEGTFKFTSVSISGNRAPGIRVRGTLSLPGLLVLRNTGVFSNSSDGIVLQDHAGADLGTVEEPGANRFTGNAGAGLNAVGKAGQRRIDAVGNTWLPLTQGTDMSGRYHTAGLVHGPVPGPEGNFTLEAGWDIWF